MGGAGSGCWTRLDSRTRVEDCLTLDIRCFHADAFKSGTNGQLHWESTLTGERLASVEYAVRKSPDDGLLLELKYATSDSQTVTLPIRLQNTRPNFGGTRRWLCCPLVVGGVACNRRVGKLYLPPGEHRFGCRTCHGLTYRSCQESHLMERFCASAYGESVLRRMQNLSGRACGKRPRPGRLPTWMTWFSNWMPPIRPAPLVPRTKPPSPRI